MKFDIDNQRPVIDHYGVTEQTIVWMEELDELGQAASKCYRDPSGERVADMAEEIADVLICIRQMMQEYDISQSLVQGIICEKQDRQRRRMEKE